jgi:hypothetical protein
MLYFHLNHNETDENLQQLNHLHKIDYVTGSCFQMSAINRSDEKRT